MLILAASSAVLTLCNSAAINPTHLSPWNDDRDRWNFFPTTRRPYIWEWNLSTLTPRYITSDRDDTGIKILIIVPTIFAVLLIVICRHCFCRPETDLYTSTPTVHPPPIATARSSRRRSHRNPETASISQTVPVLSRNYTTAPSNSTLNALRDDLFSYTPNRNLQRATGVSSSRDNAADEPPPPYSAVVEADLNAGKIPFPGVKPSAPDLSPPKYDDKNTAKY